MIFCTGAFTNYYDLLRRATIVLLATGLLLAGCAPRTPSPAAEPAAEPATAEPAVTEPGPADPDPYVQPAPARYPAAREAYIERRIADMSLERKVAQLLIIELASPRTGGALTELDTATADRLRALQPGGIVLYGGNIETVEQVTGLIAGARETAEIPLFVAIDEEGGLVSRLRHLGEGVAMRLPAASVVGAAGDPLLAYRAGRALGLELRSLGINLNFAPVLDVAVPGENPFLESRTYSGDPAMVARLGVAFLRGLQNYGVGAAVKHFPGHGTAAEDSHYGSATATADVERLEEVDWHPFRRAVDAGTDGIMVAHLAVPALTGDSTPASVSSAVLEGAARETLGFDGLLISDAVTMGGLAEAIPEQSPAVAVVAAGGDIVLTPARPERARDAILRAVREGRISEARIDASVRRVLRAKIDRGILVPSGDIFERRFPRLRDLTPETVLGAPEHHALVESLRQRAGMY